VILDLAEKEFGRRFTQDGLDEAWNELVEPHRDRFSPEEMQQISDAYDASLAEIESGARNMGAG
jgi:hypothetical protein